MNRNKIEPLNLREDSDKQELIDSLDELSLIINDNPKHSPSHQPGGIYNRSFSEKNEISCTEIRQFIFKNQGKDFALLLFFSFLTVILLISIPFLTKILINLVVFSLDYIVLTQIGVTFFLISLCIALFSISRQYVTIRLSTLLDHDFSSALVARILQLPLRFFHTMGLGDLMTRINIAQTIRRALSSQTLKLLELAPFSLLYLIPLFFFNASLAWVVLVISILALIITAIIFKQTAHMHQSKLHLTGILDTQITEIASGISTIRLYASENSFFSKWEKNFFLYKKIDWRIARWQSIVTICNACLSPVSLMLIYGVALFQNIYTLQDDAFVVQAQVADFMAFFAAYLLLSGAVKGASKALMSVAPIIPLGSLTQKLLQETPINLNTKSPPPHLTGEIRIDEVNFKYDSGMDFVLKNVSLYANPGEFIGIVGRSGSGKSTLVKLLTGFENPENGAIFYNGQDLATLQLNLIRSQLGIVLQTSRLIGGTLRDNINLGGNYSDHQIQEALTQAGLVLESDKFPRGLDTHLTSYGTTLSHVQKQLLLLARALIGQPKILILDEIFNGLDFQTQEIIFQNIAKMNTTRIIFTHHQNMLREADRIYSLDQGKISKLN